LVVAPAFEQFTPFLTLAALAGVAKSPSESSAPSEIATIDFFIINLSD
jgi:hypothetical protein